MSERLIAAMGDLGGEALAPVGSGPGPSPTTWTDKIAALQTQGVTVYRWGRSEDTAGTTYTMEVGANGTIVNPVVGDYDQGALLGDSNGGSSIGLIGGFPNPTYITIATVEQATWELTALLQVDRLLGVRQVLFQTNTGADVAGGSECKLAEDGAGALRYRFETADSTGARVIKEGSTLGQVPIGETVMVSWVRTEADLECYTNGEPRTLTLLQGTLSTWTAPAAGTSYIGAFVAAGGSSNGLDGLLGEWLITSPLTADQRAFLAAHARQNVVAALDLDAGEVNEAAEAVTIPVIQNIHPATGNTITISTPPIEGTAEEVGFAIVYTPPASVTEDTPDTVGYTTTVGAVTSAEATVSITVLNEAEPQPPSTLAEDAPLPTPLNTIIGTTANFNDLLGSGGSAQPGDRINLSNGSYGSRTISVSGTQANPIVVRAANFVSGSTSHGVTTGSITVNGSWVIISGIDITGAYGCKGSNNRITRSRIHGSNIGCLFGPDTHDNMVDHCEIFGTLDRMFYMEDPKTAHHITIARCWVHSMASGGSTTASFAFLWQDENEYRERNHHVIVRLCYCGPGESPDVSNDYIHSKGSEQCYAFNRWDVGGGLLVFRFGFRKQFIGNYHPSGPLRLWDDSHRVYGNRLGEVQCPMGISAYYDMEKSLITSNQGGFPATTRLRMSGNIAGSTILGRDFSDGSWCNRTDGPLPDMRPAGDAKPARGPYLGVTYAAIPVGDGISIRAHSGTVTTATGNPCMQPQAQNVSNLPSSAAPASWLSDLLAQFPWIEGICPNPTSQTGGFGDAHPSFVAQQLTRGDAGTPNTGPFRNSAGGLP